MHIEADLDAIHSERLNELSAKMNQPLAEILAKAIDRLYQQEASTVQSEEAIIRRLRSRYSHLPSHVSLADELIAERRQEAMRENNP
jgi:hypothetical protein